MVLFHKTSRDQSSNVGKDNAVAVGNSRVWVKRVHNKIASQLSPKHGKGGRCNRGGVAGQQLCDGRRQMALRVVASSAKW
jgi:hypothetical protein